MSLPGTSQPNEHSPRLSRTRLLLRTPAFITCCVLLFALLTAWGTGSFSPNVHSTLPSPGPHRVERVIDGDTLLLETGHRVRLLGVDTPELARDGKPDETGAVVAKNFLRNAIEGRDVVLEYDRERLDRYRRVLAYVRRAEDEWFANHELLRNGLARTMPRFPLRGDIKRSLKKAEDEARQRRLGIWAD